MTVDDYLKFYFKDIYDNATQYRIIGSSKSNLGDLESNKMILYEYFDESIKAMRNVAIDPKTNTAYIVKYIAPPGMFAKYLPIAEQMMNSFQISK
jgi:hypothetical protein